MTCRPLKVGEIGASTLTEGVPPPYARIHVEQLAPPIAWVTLELHLHQAAVAHRTEQPAGSGFEVRILRCFDERARSSKVHGVLAQPTRDDTHARLAIDAQRREGQLLLTAARDQLLD